MATAAELSSTPISGVDNLSPRRMPGGKALTYRIHQYSSMSANYSPE